MTRHRHNYPTKAEVDRLTGILVMAAKAAGLQVTGVAISPDGTIRTLDNAPPPSSAYERWQVAQSENNDD
jgi:hypothetical protein